MNIDKLTERLNYLKEEIDKLESKIKELENGNN